MPNRLIVVVQELHTAPVVSAQVWVKTGSVYEQEHVGQGLSHFLEHLLASGATTNRSEQQSHDILGRIGASTNAQTGMSTVRYYINTTAPHAAEAVDLLSDWMQHSLIPDSRYQRERQVDRSASSTWATASRHASCGSSRSRPVTASIPPGTRPSVTSTSSSASPANRFTISTSGCTCPNNTVLFVVVGDVDRKKIVDQVAGLWAGSEAKKLPTIALPVEPEITKPRSVTGTADMDKPRLRLAYRPGTRLGGARAIIELDLLSVILGRGEASRLVRRVRDGQRLVNTIDAFNMSDTWAEGFFGVDAEIAVPKSTRDRSLPETIEGCD